MIGILSISLERVHLYTYMYANDGYTCPTSHLMNVPRSFFHVFPPLHHSNLHTHTQVEIAKDKDSLLYNCTSRRDHSLYISCTSRHVHVHAHLIVACLCTEVVCSLCDYMYMLTGIPPVKTSYTPQYTSQHFVVLNTMFVYFTILEIRTAC